MDAMVMGAGEHTYEWVEGWAKIPAGVSLGYTHGVAEDSQGRIIVHNQSKDAVVFFDPEGNFISSWGAEFQEGAHGLTLSREDSAEFLYLADIARHAVYKTTLEGEQVWALGWPREAGVYEKEDEYTPTNVAVAPNGDFYAADGYGKGYIHQYNKDAEYIRTWGGPGDGPGQMNCPHGVWVDTRGAEPVVIVADRGNVRLQIFTLNGELLEIISHDLLHPCHFDQRGADLLIPDLFGRLTIFGADNQLITHLGENAGVEKIEEYPNLPRSQREPGKFISPHMACWDRHGGIFAVEWISDGRITKLRRV